MKKIVVLLVSLFSLSATCAQSAAPHRLLVKAQANDLALYAMMASNAYAGDSDKIYFPLESLGWKKVDLKGNPVPSSRNSYAPRTPLGNAFSNLQFDIWEDNNSDRTVIAFKGTHEKPDWFGSNFSIGISISYKSAKRHVKEYMDSHPSRKVSLTGHSLGGGLALSVSVWQGVDAVVFNSSPRIFDGRKNMNRPASRTAVFQKDEILESVRSRYPKFLRKIKPEEIIETNFDYSGRNTHRSDLLAQGLLSCSTEPALQTLAKGLDLSVFCYLDKPAAAGASLSN